MSQSFGNEIAIEVPGSTSNMGAGFDTVGLALQIYLTVKAKKTGVFKLELKGEGKAGLPEDESNLVVKTYLAACKEFHLEPVAFHLTIQNDIPIKRGLGSSGAAIAAGLYLVQHQSGHKLPVRELLELGCKIEGHPENLVASFLGGFSVNCYTGQKLTYRHFRKIPPLQAVLLVPEFSISTVDARRLLPAKMPFADAVANVQRCGLLVAALTSGDFSLLREAVKDKLHQPFRKKLIPGFDAILNAAYYAGARAVFLSGSGSTVLALADGHTDNIAEAMQLAICDQSYASEIRIVDIDTKGARVK
ncbi:MAG: homoserine kinase [bacterium]